jgi:hypothetical protein
MSRAGYLESREVVFRDFFSDFKSTKDWIFGRGIDGKILRTINIEQGIRGDTIENGFLTIILKGGLLYAIPFTFILLRASYLGFFRSKNDLSKALASICLIHIIMMFYSSIPEYSTRYIFIWISVSACFTPQIREYSNEEIYQAINLKFKSSKLNT